MTLQEMAMRFCGLSRTEAKQLENAKRLSQRGAPRLSNKKNPRDRFVLNKQSEDDPDEAELLIYGDIGMGFWSEGITARGVLEEIAQLDTERLNVRINSGGGDVFEGFAIYNAIREFKGTARVSIDSMAASAAAVIASAGDEVSINPIGMMMIHDAFGMMVGNAADARAFADVLDKIDGQIAEAFRRKTGKSLTAIRAAMDAETYYTAEEAKTFGLVDTIRDDDSQDDEDKKPAQDAARVPAGAETEQARHSARLAAQARLRLLDI